MQSLNQLRGWFMSGQGVEEDQTDIHTTIAIRFADGSEFQGDLSIGWFDDKSSNDHIGVELWLPHPDIENPDELRYTIHRSGYMDEDNNDAWTLDQIRRVFHINPDAAIWEKETPEA